MKLRGYFLTPEGELMWVPGSHIETVIADPARFGVTAEYIDERYEFYKEPKPVEQKARADILVRILGQRPWVRVRERKLSGGSLWELQLSFEHTESMTQLRTFAKLVTAGGQPGMPSAAWKIDQVHLLESRGTIIWSGTLELLLHAELAMFPRRELAGGGDMGNKWAAE
jgi:hypothetical protein